MIKKSRFTKIVALLLSFTLFTGAAAVYGATFNDVSDNHWAAGFIEFAVGRGLIASTGENEFSPETPITRGEYVTALYTLTGASETYSSTRFPDVAEDDPAMPHIEWAVSNGILSGIDGLFYSGNPITREQVAVMMTNTAVYMGKGPQGAWAIWLQYVDLEEISDWAFEGVMFCYLKDVMTGNPGGVFDPKGNVTRAQAAALLQRFEANVLLYDVPPYEPEDEYETDTSDGDEEDTDETVFEGQDPILLARSFASSVAIRYAEYLSGEWGDLHEEMLDEMYELGPENDDYPLYNEFLELLNEYTEEIRARGMYILYSPFSGVINYVISVDTFRGLEAFGEIREFEEAFGEALMGNQATGTDAWLDDGEYYLSAYAAIYKSNGEVMGILGVDYPSPEFAEFYQQTDPSDEAVTAAYHKALEAYNWFHYASMPFVDEHIVIDDYLSYNKVNHSEISTLSELEAYLLGIFAPEMVDSLLVDSLIFIEHDGELYSLDAAKGSNILAGEERYEIIRSSGNSIIFRVSVDIYDMPPWEDDSQLVDVEVKDSMYEFIDGNWVFSSFLEINQID